jgi:hypothetical protein
MAINIHPFSNQLDLVVCEECPNLVISKLGAHLDAGEHVPWRGYYHGRLVCTLRIPEDLITNLPLYIVHCVFKGSTNTLELRLIYDKMDTKFQRHLQRMQTSIPPPKHYQSFKLENLESKKIEKKAFSWLTVRLLVKLHLQILYLRLFNHLLYSKPCIQKQLQIIKEKA